MKYKRKRALILASVASMIDQFNMPNIGLLQEMGYQVDVACNFREGSTCSDEEVLALRKKLKKMGVSCYQIDFARDITRLWQNLKSLWQVERLLMLHKYEFLHCHSPIGGVVGRIAAKQTGTKVIYTAHGFHFYKGAKTLNWLIYYPIEKLCSYWTDILITINQEDYAFAKARLKAKRVTYVPGVGVDLDRFRHDHGGAERDKMRASLNIPPGMLWVLCVGELIGRKNHETLIRAAAEMEGVYLTIAGQGPLEEYLRQLIKELNVSDRVKLLGYRSDVASLAAAADVFALPSFQEGLSLALMEGMSCGRPVICSRIRGNTDLIEEGKGGFLFDPHSVEDALKALKRIKSADLEAMGIYNTEKVSQFGLGPVLERERRIYEEISCGGGK